MRTRSLVQLVDAIKDSDNPQEAYGIRTLNVKLIRSEEYMRKPWVGPDFTGPATSGNSMDAGYGAVFG